MTRPTPDLAQLVLRDLPRQGSAVLAVSGGLDSMALLDVTAEAARKARCRITVATFDHASGAHSARATSFVVRKALAYGLPVVAGRAARREHTEAAWRAARWAFLRSVADTIRGAVLTAHTQDDLIETVLMRAMRGAGARGLAGLGAASDVRRPFLGVSRRQLLERAEARSLDWIEDPTNRSTRYLRNRVRLELLPALRRAAPGIDRDLLEIAQHAAAWRAELAMLVDRGLTHRAGRDACGAAMLDVAATELAGYSRAELALIWPELASRIGIVLDSRGTRRASEFTISGRVGGRIQLSGGWELARSRTSYELLRMRESRPTHHSSGDREGESEQSFGAPMTWDRWTFNKNREAPARDGWRAELPAEESLRIRAWRAGDKLQVLQHGRLIARKVKYFLSDAGISGHIRARWPVVLAGDEVVWIPGVRRSDAATVRSGRPVVTYICDYLDRRP